MPPLTPLKYSNCCCILCLFDGVHRRLEWPETWWIIIIDNVKSESEIADDVETWKVRLFQKGILWHCLDQLSWKEIYDQVPAMHFTFCFLLLVSLHLKSHFFGSKWCFFQPSCERNPRISSMLQLEERILEQMALCNISFYKWLHLSKSSSIMCFRARRLK